MLAGEARSLLRSAAKLLLPLSRLSEPFGSQGFLTTKFKDCLLLGTLKLETQSWTLGLEVEIGSCLRLAEEILLLIELESPVRVSVECLVSVLST